MNSFVSVGLKNYSTLKFHKDLLCGKFKTGINDLLRLNQKLQLKVYLLPDFVLSAGRSKAF